MAGRIRKGFVEAVLLAVVAGVVLGAGWVMARAYDTRKAYTPTNLIRLHIIGNSNSMTDQEVKLKVRDSVLNTFGEYLLHAEDAKHAERIIAGLLPRIEQTARECLADSGIQYDAKAKIEIVFFPDRYYETPSGQTVFLPEGPYKSLQVVLGAGEGHNWWCVMYPPMCFVDIVRRNEICQESTEGASNIIIDNNQHILVDEESLNQVPIQFRFLLLDILEKGKRVFTSMFSSRIGAANVQP